MNNLNKDDYTFEEDNIFLWWIIITIETMIIANNIECDMGAKLALNIIGLILTVCIIYNIIKHIIIHYRLVVNHEIHDVTSCMPTYEYVCSVCKEEWEQDQSINELPIKECPKCHSATAKRQIGLTSFTLKGNGWAFDNYSGTGQKT